MKLADFKILKEVSVENLRESTFSLFFFFKYPERQLNVTRHVLPGLTKVRVTMGQKP